MTLKEYYNRPHDFYYYYNAIKNNKIIDELWEELVFDENLSDYDVYSLIKFARKIL